MIHNGTSMLAGMGGAGVMLTLLLWGGAIALILWGISGLFPTRRVHIEAEALEILRRRYARGELSREEFLRASAALGPTSPEPPRHAHDHPGGPGR